MKPEDLRPINSREEALEIRLPPRPASVCLKPPDVTSGVRYPLRGTAVEYRDPTDPVAESDWEASK
jgi:hypothetical protein